MKGTYTLVSAKKRKRKKTKKIEYKLLEQGCLVAQLVQHGTLISAGVVILGPEIKSPVGPPTQKGSA